MDTLNHCAVMNIRQSRITSCAARSGVATICPSPASDIITSFIIRL